MQELTLKIKEILDTPDDKVNVGEAALVLLKINRNRTLHDNIVRRGNVGKLKYELQKIYDYRFNSESAEEVKVLEKKAVTIIQQTLSVNQKIEESETKGKRSDHDNLPDEVKAKYLENFNIFPRMRKLHEQLKLMVNAKACDRYPFLKELKELDTQLRKNWDEYDAFVIPPANPIIPGTDPAGAGDLPPEDKKELPENITPVATITEPVIDAKKIGAARKYLSDNKTKLKELKALEDQTKYQVLLTKMQERLDLLIQANAGVSEEYLNELKELGLSA